MKTTKTASGIRFIPMTDAVYRSLNNMLANGPKVAVETVVDGLTGFIMLGENGMPKVALHIENELLWAIPAPLKFKRNDLFVISSNYENIQAFEGLQRP